MSKLKRRDALAILEVAGTTHRPWANMLYRGPNGIQRSLYIGDKSVRCAQNVFNNIAETHKLYELEKTHRVYVN